jgi:hypothetical protein
VDPYGLCPNTGSLLGDLTSIGLGIGVGAVQDWAGQIADATYMDEVDLLAQIFAPGYGDAQDIVDFNTATTWRGKIIPGISIAIGAGWFPNTLGPLKRYGAKKVTKFEKNVCNKFEDQTAKRLGEKEIRIRNMPDEIKKDINPAFDDFNPDRSLWRKIIDAFLTFF